MNDIIQLILVVILLVIAFNFTVWFSKRTRLINKIYRLKKLCNAKISLQRFPYRPMWMISEQPDIKVEILDTVYLIRIYSGGGISRSVHFANECYAASYISTAGGHPGRRRPGRMTPNPLTSGLNIGAKVRYTPPLNVAHDDPRKKVVPVLLLNPAPGNLSYVTKEKTSIRIAFTGDDLYGMKVFTASTFLIYADRMKREELRQREEKALRGYAEFDYFNSF